MHARILPQLPAIAAVLGGFLGVLVPGTRALASPLAGEQVPAGAEVGQDSLQAWLARMRKERESSRSALTVRVTSLLAELEALAAEGSSRKVEAARNALAALGPEAVPLLVPALEPGKEATSAAVFRAREVATVIAATHPTSITEELIAHVKNGSAEARANALRVLAQHGDPPRVVPLLAAIYASEEGPGRSEILAVLAELGGTDADHLIEGALRDEQPEVVRTALEALARAANSRLAASVLEFARGPSAPTHVDELLAYYKAVPQALGPAHALAMVQLSRHVALSEKTKTRLLESLARFPIELDGELQKALDPIVDGGTREVREAALVLLSVLGDRNARKTLLKPYEDVVKKSPKWSQAYVQLAEALVRIHDHKDAVREYKTALKLQSEEDRIDPGAFIGIARCYAVLGDLKSAAESLEVAPLSLKTLHELAKDPDFVALAAHPKYGKVFHLESEQ
jgi:HEAT repeat protein